MSTKKEKRLVKEGLSETDSVFDIDKNLLDDEWLNQPKLYFKWAVQLEDARAKFEEAKVEFDLVKSELDLEIRDNPHKFHLPEKITEKMIVAVVLTQPEYKEAQQAVFTDKHRVGILQAAVTALDHRKKALEKLVDLHGQKYFATPRVSEDSRESMQEVEKQSVRRKRTGRKKG